MDQITGAVIAITLVLAAVFIPSALQAGSAGAIYKQFALTIAMAMVFSAFLALGFTPALCATLLKPTSTTRAAIRSSAASTASTTGCATPTSRHIGSAVRHAPRWMVVFAALALLCGFLFCADAGQLPARRRPGLRARRSCSCRRARRCSRTNAVFEQVRAAIEKHGRLRRHVRRSPASASSARARTSAWSSSSSSRGASARSPRPNSSSRRTARCSGDPRRADLRDQPADGERASASSAASTCTCRIAPARAATR